MSDRALSRHRAPQPAVTPLSDLSDTLTGQLATIGRSGAIVAMSTGLVASVSAPAQALTHTVSAPAVSSLDSSATGTALTVGPISTGRTGLIGSPALAHDAAIAAPAAATVTFETGSFKVAPTPVHKTVKAIAKTRSTTQTSASTGTRATATTPAPTGSVSGSSVLAIAARYVGTPYLYGGTTPNGFDCSGFTGYVYRQLGISLPRTANEQLQGTKRISRSQARPGDLVFFVSGGRAYHNGIYAGNNMMYDSPRSGKTLQKREIWSADVVFTRVTG